MPLPLSKLCTDYDRRIAVFRALQAPVSEITVAEICAGAGISRKRFYTLFGGKEDVFRWYLDLCFNASIYEIGRTFTWREGVEALLHYISEERETFRISLRDRTEPASRYWPMNQARTKNMKSTLELKDIAIDRRLELEMELYSSMVPTLIRHWIETNGEISVEEYASLWVDCVPGTLKNMLERN